MASHAFVRDSMKPATTPSTWRVLRQPPKTSSERGRKFRARQRERAAVVEHQVAVLRDQIRALTASQSMFNERLVRTREAQEGSLQHTIREFFTLCQDGLEAPVDPAVGSPRQAERVRLKENYMRSVFDPDTLTGGSRGVGIVIDQWRRYTVFHGRFHLDLGHIAVIGPEDAREFCLHVKLTVRLSRKTFEHVFPAALSDEALVQRLMDRVVQYDCVVRMRFSDDGRINVYNLDVDFIKGLRQACGSLEEVAKLLNHSTITPTCTIQDSLTDRPQQ